MGRSIKPNNMKKYIVSAQDFEIEVEANGLDEARFKFKEEYPQHKYPEFFDCGDEENVVYGYCENTGLPIFEHDTFQQDQECVMWLTEDKYYNK